jgi:hypothetical protein
MLQIPKRWDPMQSYPESDDQKRYQQDTRQIYYTKVEEKKRERCFTQDQQAH